MNAFSPRIKSPVPEFSNVSSLPLLWISELITKSALPPWLNVFSEPYSAFKLPAKLIIPALFVTDKIPELSILASIDVPPSPLFVKRSLLFALFLMELDVTDNEPCSFVMLISLFGFNELFISPLIFVPCLPLAVIVNLSLLSIFPEIETPESIPAFSEIIVDSPLFSTVPVTLNRPFALFIISNFSDADILFIVRLLFPVELFVTEIAPLLFFNVPFNERLPSFAFTVNTPPFVVIEEAVFCSIPFSAEISTPLVTSIFLLIFRSALEFIFVDSAVRLPFIVIEPVPVVFSIASFSTSIIFVVKLSTASIIVFFAFNVPFIVMEPEPVVLIIASCSAVIVPVFKSALGLVKYILLPSASTTPFAFTFNAFSSFPMSLASNKIPPSVFSDISL